MLRSQSILPIYLDDWSATVLPHTTLSGHHLNNERVVIPSVYNITIVIQAKKVNLFTSSSSFFGNLSDFKTPHRQTVRMESTGENPSVGGDRWLIQLHSKSQRLTNSRIVAKGKGELQTYWVEPIAFRS